jgi:hypothetical protein
MFAGYGFISLTADLLKVFERRLALEAMDLERQEPRWEI